MKWLDMTSGTMSDQATNIKKVGETMKEKYFSIAGIIVGLISVILSFVVKSQNYSNYEYSSSYGGDAYTGIQNAAASTANNVGYLINAVTWGFFAILFVFGLACIVYFGSKFLVSMEGEAGSEKKNNSGISLFSAR
ncbi:MAG: hypothetical protein J6M22_03315, partial [Firmicutes bacterium]|nr:hypothetical protein [Bacillota bacterium]